MERDKVMEKIRKLLNLSSDNPNDNESQAALAMAQKLMMEYKISEREVSDNKKQECVTKKTAHYFTQGNVNTYVSDLADIISENFCCINFFRSWKGKRKKFICFMGLEDDVALCEEAMNVAMNAIYTGYCEVWRDLQRAYNLSHIPASIWNPAKKGYIDGYLAGLTEVFEEQKAKHQEWGLVLVVPPEAEDFAASLGRINLNRADAISYAYYTEGYDDGKKFNMNKKINSGKEYFLEE